MGQKSWEIITTSSPALCMDPAPEKVRIYKPPQDCGNTPPHVCYQGNQTVKDLYDVTFACTPEHNKQYANVSLYKNKCNLTSDKLNLHRIESQGDEQLTWAFF